MPNPEQPSPEPSTVSPPNATDPGGNSGALPFFIVGIGASAGGHEPLEEIFTHLPTDIGLAYVVVMHLAPEGPSHLADLLRHYTTMRVINAEEGLAVQRDTIYVIPPGCFLTIQGDVFHLEPFTAGEGIHHPIDRLFTSLAVEKREAAVGIILSGFGNDGSQGVQRIKENGGLVLVQDPKTAINNPMPSRAIATGAVDLILSATEIGARLVELSEEYGKGSGPTCTNPIHGEELQLLFALLKVKTGHDFSAYKRNTILRRIDRRMACNEVQRFKQYLTILEENPQEAEALYQELLIGVTSFFRDPDAFDLLRTEVIPHLFANRSSDDPLRIWHACCATGEEAYSVGMLLQEYLEENKLQTKIQIFATDLDAGAINQARAGVYTSAIENEVSASWLQKYFTRVENSWQVRKQLREMIVFAHHNIIKDPPFSRLDLLVCRNFLIYLNPEMQKRLIALFHQVLRPDGFLFLGSAETVGLQSNLFTPVDKKWKIFTRQNSEQRMDLPFPFFGPISRMPGTGTPARTTEPQRLNPTLLAEKMLMDRYVPARVMVNEHNEVVHFSKQAGSFLVTPEGEPTRDLLRLIREELRPALRAALYKAFSEQKENRFQGIKINTENGELFINLVVLPLANNSPGERLALVIFEPAPPPLVAALPTSDASTLQDATHDSVVCHLEEQLRVTSEQLQATCEQLESSNEGFLLANEELMATNEELQSANEELQATNEELETSKEELQALNEELITVNAELQGKIEELDRTNNDLENLFTSAEIATIFLDRSLHIKRFSPSMAKLFNLIPADVGRPFRHLSGISDWTELPADAAAVLETTSPREREVDLPDDERSFILRVLPYFNADNTVDGIVLALIDITQRKKIEMALKESEANLRLFIEQAPASLAMFDREMRYLQVSCRWLDDYSLDDANILGKSHYEIFPEITDAWKETHQRGMNGEILRSEADLFVRADGRHQWIRWEIRPWVDAGDQIGGIVIFTEDITSIIKAEEVLRRYELLAEHSRDIILFVDHADGRLVEANAAACRAYGYNREELLSMNIHDLRGPKACQLTETQMDEAEDHGILFETSHRRKDGTTFVAEVNSQGAEIGGKRLLLSVIRDITERKQAADALHRSSELRRLALEGAGMGAWEHNLITDTITWSDQCYRLFGLEKGTTVDYSTIEKITHPDDQELFARAVQQAFAGENHGLFQCEHRIIWPDGSEHWLHSHGQVYFEGEGAARSPVRFTGVNWEITKEKLSALQSARLASIVSSSDDAIMSQNLHGIIESWNTGAERLFGYTAKEMIGQSITLLSPPELQHEEGQIQQTLIEGGRIEHYETVRLKNNGQEIDISLTVSPIYDRDNRIIGISKIARDITEKKRSAMALRASEERLRLALEATSEALWDWDVVSGLVYRSQRYYSLVHQCPKEDSGDFAFFVQTIHPEDIEHALTTINAHKQGLTESIDFEYRLHPKSGLQRWLKVKGKVVARDDCGEPLRITGTLADITQIKAQGEELRLSEQHRKLALEAAQAGTWEWDLTTNENIWSDELWSLYGLEPHSCCPSYDEWLKIIHPEDLQQTIEALNWAIAHQKPFRVEWRVQLQGEEFRWLMARGRPTFDENGHLVRYLGVAMDITERKGNESSRNLLKSQLQQAQKMEAIGTLAGGIAHDFNNILAAIVGYTEMAKDRRTSRAEIDKDLNKVLEASGRATNLVRQILAFSRQSQTQRAPLEPIHLIKEAVKLLRPALPSTIAIQPITNKSSQCILADPTQIHQVVMNLCTNAFHAMEANGGVLAISLDDCDLQPDDLIRESKVQPGSFVRLSIADTGPGMTPEIMEKIFDPYFTTKDIGRGTGLGLSIVHGIATAAGGFVRCESSVGEGTVFQVYLPAVGPAPQPLPTQVENDCSGKERILLVDDEVILTEMERTMLERLGYHVTVQTSSQDALEIFQQTPEAFDAVITDQTMPGLTGVDLARKILQVRPNFPIILCTGYSSLINEHQARAFGIKGFAMKPISNKALAQLLREVLDEKQR
ncbi:MAG: PAS domain S-box protein [Desulfobulbus sp.]|nr:PAS domain S-box protein [Desulfobulbus sp.]